MSRYDWSKAMLDTIAITTNANGQVIQHTKKPVKIKEDFIWASFHSYAYNHACPDWEESLEERPKWEPEEGEWVLILEPCSDVGYSATKFTTRYNHHVNLFKRGFIVKTIEEAIAKVKELGWTE